MVIRKCGAWIGHRQFLQLWRQTGELGVENLFAENLARKHLRLSDPYSSFMLLGDLGAKVLQYYAGFKHEWLPRHQLPIKVEARVVNWHDYDTQITSQFYDQPWENLTSWQEVLQSLSVQLQELDFLY